MTNKLTFDSLTFTLDEHESVLECLLRNQQQIPYACKAGTCQACLIRTVNCEATESSKKWIKPALQAQGYTLACQWVPDCDVEAVLPSIEDFSVEVTLKRMDKLNDRVIRLILTPKEKREMFHYYPGQYLTLINPEGIGRSYSIANNYELDGYIELHISETLHGIFTHWLFNEAQEGDSVHIRGPAGDCFYTNNLATDSPVLLAGTGTGLAPLYGILHEALAAGHKGQMKLFHGGRTPAHLYYVDKLTSLAEKYTNFSYYPCARECSEQDQQTGFHSGALEEVFARHLPEDQIANTHVFLCGNPDLVHKMRKTAFLKGVKSSNIYCDPFIERTVVKPTI